MENSEQRNEKKEIVILVNGPGELASYVRPTVNALVSITKDLNITLVLTPCPYSTGKEEYIAKNIPGVTNVINVSAFVNWMLFRKDPKISFSENGLIVFLGGDVLYGKMLSKKLKFPAIAYSESYAKWPKIYKKCLVPDDQTADKFIKQGFPKEQIKVIGDLMVDSIRIMKTKQDVFRKYGFDPEKKLVSFLPGSRGFQVGYTFSFYPKTIEEISRISSNCQFAYIISPYLPERTLKRELYKAGFTISGDNISYKGKNIRIILDDQHEVLAASDIAVTIPGTNTAEVSIIGTPMVSFFPLDSFGVVPLEGVWDLIGKLPLLGYYFKKYYVRMIQKKTRFFTIPNKKAGKEIVPELNGDIKPADVALKVISLLKDPTKLAQTSKDLKKALGEKGAANRMAEEILSEIIL